MMSNQFQPDRLLRKKTMLREKFDGISDSTAQRHLFSRPDFPKPVSGIPGVNLYSEREINELLERMRHE